MKHISTLKIEFGQVNELKGEEKFVAVDRIYSGINAIELTAAQNPDRVTANDLREARLLLPKVASVRNRLVSARARRE